MFSDFNNARLKVGKNGGGGETCLLLGYVLWFLAVPLIFRKRDQMIS